jgi:hypothetical protein
MKLPKYKRDQFTFISNLSDYTANDAFPNTYKRDGYLLSEHYTNNKTTELAEKVRRRRNLLISDNGNYSRMKAVAKIYEKEGGLLLQQAQDEEKKRGEISKETRAARMVLVTKIAQSCQEKVLITDYNEVIEKQLSIQPHYMIGMEDLTIPVLMLCNLMHPVFAPNPNHIINYQNNTLDYFKKQQSGEYGAKTALEDVAKFLVLHAYDYASAFQAGKNSLSTSKDGIAISYGGAMHSRRWINSLNFGKREVKFDEKLPEAYLIAQSLTLGVVNGHPTDIPYHILGVGTPILIALIGYQLRHSRAVSIDSTAPFKDAFIGKLYGSKHAYIKMDMFKLVAYNLINNKTFYSSSPFYKSFAQKYEHDWVGLRKKLGIKPNYSVKELTVLLKQRGDLLEAYLPFFTPITGSLERGFLQDLRIARAGYNYWELKKICSNVKKRRGNKPLFKKWIENQVERYTRVASYKWAKTVEQTYELTERYRLID